MVGPDPMDESVAFLSVMSCVHSGASCGAKLASRQEVMNGDRPQSVAGQPFGKHVSHSESEIS
jgi:hypothetical protein